jgi:hypothetical protein
MNNNDYFQIEISNKNFAEAARLACDFGEGKGSRSGAWSWANAAIDAAKMAGIELNPGNLSWPDFKAMKEQLKGK